MHPIRLAVLALAAAPALAEDGMRHVPARRRGAGDLAGAARAPGR
jgi:hypothetical protein